MLILMLFFIPYADLLWHGLGSVENLMYRALYNIHNHPPILGFLIIFGLIWIVVYKIMTLNKQAFIIFVTISVKD